MRHIVLLNVARHGYTTWAGSPSEGFHEQPLGVTTEKVSESTLAASNELNEVVRQPATSVSVALRHDVGQRPVVAFGAFFPHAVDDKGRAGLVLVHVLELEDTRNLLAVVWAVVDFLAPSNVAACAEGVATVAVEEGAALPFLQRYVPTLETRLDRARLTAPAVTPGAVPLGSIEHDCAGGASIAWLVAAHAVTEREPGWSFSDREQGHVVKTVLRPEGTAHVRASELFNDLLQDRVANGGYDPEFRLRPVERTPSTLIESTRSFGSGEKTTVDSAVSAPDTLLESPISPVAVRPAQKPASRRGGWLFPLAVGVGGALVGMLLGFISGSLSHPDAAPRDCGEVHASVAADAGVAVPVPVAVRVQPQPPVVVAPVRVTDAGAAPRGVNGTPRATNWRPSSRVRRGGDSSHGGHSEPPIIVR